MEGDREIMLVIEDILNKMKVHFPKWMDIRRKVKTSVGGNFLNAISSEICDIESAINDYVKDFFISSYTDNPDDIIAFLYKSNIGDIGTDLIIVTDGYELANTKDYFYKNKNTAFLEDGFIYIKEDIKNLEISVNKCRNVITLNKTHVWNVFDEFAIFLGLRRFDNETNKELLNRILNFSNIKANSSKMGLQDAIVANLINIDPHLTKDDVKIENVTARNLVEKYDKYETLLEYLAKINKDVYMHKRWDIDTWVHDIDSVEYLPHAWDIALPAYADGVGFNGDLKVKLSEAFIDTDVNIALYRKDTDSIITYIKNNNVKEETMLKLRRYNHDLRETSVKYKIQATEVVEIEPSSIEISAYENKIGEHTVNIQDVIDPFYYDIDIDDRSHLDSGFRYVAEFYPADMYSDFIINNFNQINSDGEKNSLIKQNVHGFQPFGEGVKHSNIKRNIQHNYQFLKLINSHKNFNGFVISDTSKESVMEIDIQGCENQEYLIAFDSSKVPVMPHQISMTNCYTNNGNIIADTVSGDKLVELDIEANSVEFDINGSFQIMYIIDGEQFEISKQDNSEYHFKIDEMESFKSIKIKVYMYGNDGKSYMSNIVYSKFKLQVKIDGKNSNASGRLDNNKKSLMSIFARNYVGQSLTINKIFVGTPLKSTDTYGEIEIDTALGNNIESDFTGCKMRLKKINAQNEVVKIFEDYKPKKFYSPSYDNGQIVLILDDFKDIEDIYSENGYIETTNYGNGFIQHTLNLTSKTPVSEITIKGSIDKLIEKTTLKEVLKNKGVLLNNCKTFIAKNEDALIIRRDNQNEQLIEVYKRDLFTLSQITNIVIKTPYDNVAVKYINNDSEIISTSNFNEFSKIALTPTSSDTYVAINESITLFPHSKNIDIVNTFNNGFNQESKDKMFYKVESLNDEYEVKFSTGASFNLLPNFSLESKQLEIKIKNMEDMIFNFEDSEVSLKYNLDSSVPIPRVISIKGKENLDISQYMILNDSNIEYSDRLNDSDNISDYEIRETLVNADSPFFKLKYSNVQRIDSVTYISEDGVNKVIEADKYKLLKNEGILLINTDINHNGAIFSIKYCIRIAKNIITSTDELYEKVSYNYKSLKLIDNIEILNVKNGSNIDMRMYSSYKNIDRIEVKCSEIGYIAKIDGDIITFTQDISENTVAVKSGYYYMGGEEHYMFASLNNEKIDRLDNFYMYDVIKDNKKLILNQEAFNHVHNSKFNLKSKGEIYNLNCNEFDIKSISKLKSITACDNFNNWKSFGLNLEIGPGLNDTGIKFTATDKNNSYAYLNITEFLEEGKQEVLSLYLKGDCHAYLAKSKNLISSTNSFNQNLVLDIYKEIEDSQLFENIKSTYVEKNNETHYIVITGTGTIDDIIITDKDNMYKNIHKKNISHLNLEIKENIYTEYTTRLFLTNKYGASFDGTELKSDNRILNTSYVNWGFTRISNFEKENDFKKCTLINVDVESFNDQCMIKTHNNVGRIVTPAISIGNTNTVKNLVIKINDVLLDSMKGFKITLLTSSSKHSNYREVLKDSNNMFSVPNEKLDSYIKLDIEMGSNKVINIVEVFAEYLSKDGHSPSEKPTITGTYISKVLDAKFNERFLVKNINLCENNFDIKKYSFLIRASRGNNSNSVWTEWREIDIYLEENIPKIKNRIVFDGFRYYQFKLVLNGEDASIKLNHIDLEVL